MIRLSTMIRLGAGALILALRSGAHRAGVGKIRLGAGALILTLRRGAHRAGVGKTRLGAGVLITLRRGARRAGVGKIRLGAGALILTLRRGAHRAGVGKIRLKERRSPGWGRKDPSRTTIYSYSKERRGRKDPSRSRRSPGGLEAIRSVSGISCSQERRSPGWRR